MASFLFFVLACNPLVGTWTGELDCGEGSVDGELELAADGAGAYTGDGYFEMTCYDSEYNTFACDFEYTVEVEQDSSFGEQDIDVSFDDCTLNWSGGSQDTECGDDPDMEWDGADTISGDLDGCDIEFERD